ncbi:MAG: hypothetical protein ACUVTR_07565, partial [Dehalococcoidia bacterium]
AVPQTQFYEQDGGAWLQVQMPAFYGPHSDRPWVQRLRALAYGDNRMVACASQPETKPTKS